MMSSVYSKLLILVLCTSFVGCAAPTIESVRNLKEKPSPSRIAGPKFKGYWNDDSDAKGKTRIEISLTEQRAIFYKGDTLLGESPISTGREGYETKPGKFTVINKELQHFSNLYGEFVNSAGKIVGYGTAKDTPPAGTKYEPSPMPYYLRISQDGTGLHAGFLPGYPASHGCIRMPANMAQKFYENAEVGVEVTVNP